MPRTTDELVIGLIEWDDTIPLEPFIATASMLVDKVVATAKNPDGTDYYSTDDLELIERWLSGHFYTVRDPTAVYESVSSLGTKFDSQVDLNLNLTRYGQQAMLLDTAGGLASTNRSLNKGPIRRKTSVTWLGKKGC